MTAERTTHNIIQGQIFFRMAADSTRAIISVQRSPQRKARRRTRRYIRASSSPDKSLLG
jgi:hypothetical protein